MKSTTLLSICALVECAPIPGQIKRQMIGLVEKFDRLVCDGDGHLTSKDLKEAERLSSFTTTEIFGVYDKRGDGKVSQVEGQGGIKRLPEAREIAAEQYA